MTTKIPETEDAHAVSAPSAAQAPPDVIYLPDDRQRTKKVTSGSERRKRHHREWFRTNDDEHKQLHDLLRTRDLGLGEFVMTLTSIDSGKLSRPRRRASYAIDRAALLQAVVAVNRVGTNVNQIARVLNELAALARQLRASDLEREILSLAPSIHEMRNSFAVPMAALMAALDPPGGDT